MKVLFHFNANPALQKWAREQCGNDIELVTCPEADETTFLQLLPRVEVIWHSLKPITAEHLELGQRLRLIQKLGIGVNTIDLDAARRRGVAVCNTPGANSRAVAEMALLLILAVLRRLPDLSQRCREPNGWAIPDSLQQNLSELGGRTVGLVGFGAAPSILAPWLAAMDAKIIYYDISQKAGVRYPYLPLDELIARSDVLSLHVPLTPETKNLIGASRLKRMKSGSILINTARGELVDESALIDALQHGPLAAAGLDVFAEEPTSPKNPLLHLANVIATPHAAWLTRETLHRCITVALANTRHLLNTEELIHRVV
jgi:phosphoglycerate dehydrogenase-like enzyme